MHRIRLVLLVILGLSKPSHAVPEIKNEIDKYPSAHSQRDNHTFRTASEKQVNSLLSEGISNLNSGEYEAAAQAADSGLKLAKQLRNRLLEAQALRLRARAYQATDQFSSGLPLMLRALTLFEQLGNTSEVINTNLALIEFYRANANPEMGWQLYQTTRSYLHRGKMTDQQAARLFHRAAACASESGRFDSVIVLSERSLSYSKPLGLASDMATSYNEMGFYYSNRNMNEQALHFLHLAEEQAIRLRHWPQVLNVLRNVMLLQLRDNRLAAAESTMVRMKAVPQNPPIFRRSHDFLELQATLLKAQGRMQEAYAKLDSARLLHIALVLRQHNRQLNELNSKYQTEKAKLLARQYSQRAQANREERNIYLVSTIIIAGLLGLLALAFVRLRQRKKRVEEQRLAIEQINEQLSHSLKVQKSLYTELDHRVKNNLAVLSSLLYLQASNAPEQIKAALRQTRSRIESMALLHRELLNSVSYEKEESLTAYVRQLLTELHSTFGRPGLEVKQEIICPPAQISPALATSLGLVINELVTNSYKHAFGTTRSGFIKVALQAKTDGLLHLEYSDSGSGISSIEEARKAGSLGLSIIELLTQQHQGSFLYETRDDHPYFYLTFRLEEPAEEMI